MSAVKPSPKYQVVTAQAADAIVWTQDVDFEERQA